MTVDFAETYRRKSSDELLRLARDKDSLQEVARRALDAEMEKRGLGESDAARFEKEEYEVNERAAERAIVKKQTGTWAHVATCLLIFGTSGILTVVIADYILKPPSEVVGHFTEASLSAATALAFLAILVPSRWLTFKRIVIFAVIFSFALFGFIVWSAATARRH